MEKVIQIIKGKSQSYHVSFNPNNGYLTETHDIEKASVFTTSFDMEFIARISEYYKKKYTNCVINAISKNDDYPENEIKINITCFHHYHIEDGGSCKECGLSKIEIKESFDNWLDKTKITIN